MGQTTVDLDCAGASLQLANRTCPPGLHSSCRNVAVGGKWAGAPDAASYFPATMLVDYVRVWGTPSNNTSSGGFIWDILNNPS